MRLRDLFARLGGRQARGDTPRGDRVCFASEGGVGASDFMDARYSLSGGQVCPPKRPLTEDEVRHLIADGLLRPTHEQGPRRVGLTIGCDEKTVRRARDKENTLRADLLWNLLVADDRALDPLAEHFGKRLVDIHPRPVDWNELAETVEALRAALGRVRERGRVTHQDMPQLKDLLRRVATCAEAVVGR